ncbi:hypothetical protein CRENBAI_013427 [Crenichthys baileyi]|uniref:Uncharacterized protein n=1 Tax=Crenichthys baileyi TaxID=28760 RepID=A0AAV9SQW3_9TELE
MEVKLKDGAPRCDRHLSVQKELCRKLTPPSRQHSASLSITKKFGTTGCHPHIGWRREPVAPGIPENPPRFPHSPLGMEGEISSVEEEVEEQVGKGPDIPVLWNTAQFIVKMTPERPE